MGLFDKLKSLVSDDKKDSGTIDIVAPLSAAVLPPVLSAKLLSWKRIRRRNSVNNQQTD